MIRVEKSQYIHNEIDIGFCFRGIGVIPETFSETIQRISPVLHAVMNFTLKEKGTRLMI
jgi:hypothetical protein